MTWLDALKATALEFDGPLIWGQTDCCQLVNAYHERLTGRRYEFDYGTEGEAKRVLARAGGLQGLIRQCLGEPGELAPGSIVVSETEEGDETAGIFNGFSVWTMHPAHGLVRMPDTGVLAAWPVQ